tara:strand:+ start:360 stop:2204 length:1845 start_codon:yes stop_codon:yes gene_type:complete
MNSANSGGRSPARTPTTTPPATGEHAAAGTAGTANRPVSALHDGPAAGGVAVGRDPASARRLVEDLLGRLKRMRAGRAVWESHWQELAEFMLPRRADFSREQVQGGKRTERQYDGAPMQAARGLAASLDGMLKPKTANWFSLRAADPDLNRRSDVRRWLEDAENRLRTALYDPRARFLQRSGEVDLDLVVFGTGVLYVGEKVGERRLLFRAHHLRGVYLADDADGEIDTVFRVFRLTARQAAQAFGEDRIGAKTREALRDGNPDAEFDFLHAVYPRHERDPRKAGATSLPWASVFVDMASERLLSEGGFADLPYIVPRWETAPDEVYGRSPAMLALPDVATLNQIGKTLLRAGHKAVDPPLLAPDDGIKATPRTWPGGITYYDADMLARTGGRPPITPLNTGANLPLGREMQNDTREQVWSAFFRNVLQMPENGPQMTATEVIERREEFLRIIGPVFGRLEADYTGPLIERCFRIMLRSGMFADLPAALKGQGVDFEYASPLVRAQKQIEAAGLRKTIEELGPIAQVNPAVLENFDADRIVRDTAAANGLPTAWLVPADDVARRRDAQARSLAMPGDIPTGGGGAANVDAAAAGTEGGMPDADPMAILDALSRQ